MRGSWGGAFGSGWMGSSWNSTTGVVSSAVRAGARLFSHADKAAAIPRIRPAAWWLFPMTTPSAFHGDVVPGLREGSQEPEGEPLPGLAGVELHVHLAGILGSRV